MGNDMAKRNRQTELWARTETKNVNSFSAIGRVIDHESKRQIKILESGWVVDQETRWWNL